MALDIPVMDSADGLFPVDLDNIIILEGMDHIIAKLLNEIRESCFFGLSDISVSVSVENGICPQLLHFGIQKISFSSLIENLEHFSLIYEQLQNHLNYIFNALQSPGIHRGFFTKGKDKQEVTALLFPFNQEINRDITGIHYLVERVPGLHFLRITMEESGHARLNLKNIKHRIISHIELIDYVFNLHKVAFIIRSSLVSLCRDYKLSYKDDGLQLLMLIRFLKAAGYNSLREVTFNWSRTVISDILSGNDQKWHGNIIRLMLILPDSTTLKLLSAGKIIVTSFSGSKVYLSLTQRERNLQIDLDDVTKVSGLDEYLNKMGILQNLSESKVISLRNVHLIFIHHFTPETLSLLAAFQKLQVHAVDTLWVKYAGSIPKGYLDTILSLPVPVFSFYGLQLVTGANFHTRFIMSDLYSSIEDFKGLQAQFESEEFEFYTAMQVVAMHLFLRVLSNGDKTRVIVAEDGGYLAPLINRLALNHYTVGEVFESYGFECRTLPEETGTMEFGQWIASRYCGSVEHTRNGFDALKSVESEWDRLAFPACTLAISHYKLKDESLEVAYSCLNAIENILSGQGYVLNRRNCLVLGSLGTIGLQTMKILSYRLGSGSLSGIDIKTDENHTYNWEQVRTPDRLKDETRHSVDLIIGLVGHPVLDVSFFEDLIINTCHTSVFLASGSTKRSEFINFLDWTEHLLGSITPAIMGIPVKIKASPIEDPQTASFQGTVVTFDLEINRMTRNVKFYILSNGMPVNFQYYGVARETMDQVMTEFLALVRTVAGAQEKPLPARVLALDHDIDQHGNLLSG